MTWKLIETAPKDGTFILAGRIGWMPYIAYWGRSSPMNPQTWLGGHCKIDHIDQPTHWMLLPNPPETSEGCSND